MGPTSLERQSHLPSSIHDAIEVEIDISDLLFNGCSRDDGRLQRCYDDACQILEELSPSEQAVVNGLAKQLWYRRVSSYEDPTKHPEYCETINRELLEAFRDILKIPDDRLRQAARHIIDKVDLPDTALAA